MKNEIWKSVVGYEGLYEVSNMGRVRSLDHISSNRLFKGKVMSQFNIYTPGKRHPFPYKQVKLTKNGKDKMLLVHRLVAMAFLPNPQNLPFINHKDENPSNNRADNLEWCTPKYNSSYGGLPQYLSEVNGREVLQFSLKGEFVAKYVSLQKAQQDTKINASSILRVCKGRERHAGGFKWRYLIPTSEEEKALQARQEKEEKRRVAQLSLEGSVIAVYDTLTDAAKTTKIPISLLSSCVSGKIHTSRGFRWIRYLDYKKTNNNSMQYEANRD